MAKDDTWEPYEVLRESAVLCQALLDYLDVTYIQVKRAGDAIHPLTQRTASPLSEKMKQKIICFRSFFSKDVWSGFTLLLYELTS